MTFINKILFLIFASNLALLGCGEPPPCGRWESLPVLVKTNNDIENSAIDKINEILGIEMFAVDASGSEVIPTNDRDIILDITGTTRVACHSGITDFGKIYIEKALVEKQTETYVFAHELFHLAGLLDHFENSKLMKSMPPEDYKTLSVEEVLDQPVIDWVRETYPEYFPHFEANGDLVQLSGEASDGSLRKELDSGGY